MQQNFFVMTNCKNWKVKLKDGFTTPVVTVLPESSIKVADLDSLGISGGFINGVFKDSVVGSKKMLKGQVNG